MLELAVSILASTQPSAPWSLVLAELRDGLHTDSVHLSELPAFTSRQVRLTRKPCGTHLLVIPLPWHGDAVRGFVAYHAESDFTENEVAYARRIQPLLAAVDAHYRRVTDPRAVPPATSGRRQHGLTPREITVLSLLAKAMPATAAGRRLGISTRTVHKHIENIYRKLGTSDRLATVLRAQRLGLLSD